MAKVVVRVAGKTVFRGEVEAPTVTLVAGAVSVSAAAKKEGV